MRLFRDANRVLQSKSEQGLSGQKDRLVAGESGTGCACTAPSQRADGHTFAAACEPADDGSKRRAAANKACRALPLALLRTVNRTGRYRITSPARVDTFQPNRKQGPAFEAAKRFRVHHRAFRPCALRDDSLAVDNDWIRDCGAKPVARLR